MATEPLDDALGRRAKQLEWLLTDVDGVLTDGRLHYTAQGEELKSFDVRDGLGLKLARQVGLKVGILSARSSAALSRRGEELGLDAMLLGRADKAAGFAEFLDANQTSADRVAYAGDDLPDLPVLLRAGLSFAPADARPEVRQRVHHVLQAPGGGGAIRELVEMLLKARQEWDALVARYTDG